MFKILLLRGFLLRYCAPALGIAVVCYLSVFPVFIDKKIDVDIKRWRPSVNTSFSEVLITILLDKELALQLEASNVPQAENKAMIRTVDSYIYEIPENFLKKNLEVKTNINLSEQQDCKICSRSLIASQTTVKLPSLLSPLHRDNRVVSPFSSTPYIIEIQSVYVDIQTLDSDYFIETSIFSSSQSMAKASSPMLGFSSALPDFDVQQDITAVPLPSSVYSYSAALFLLFIFRSRHCNKAVTRFTSLH